MHVCENEDVTKFWNATFQVFYRMMKALLMTEEKSEENIHTASGWEEW